MAKYLVEISDETANFYMQLTHFSETLEDVLSKILSVAKEVMIEANTRETIKNQLKKF